MLSEAIVIDPKHLGLMVRFLARWPFLFEISLEKVVRIGNLSIGMIHGHQVFPNNCNKALEAVRRSLQVDILVHGNTHEQKVPQSLFSNLKAFLKFEIKKENFF
jgi:hypothetical protein